MMHRRRRVAEANIHQCFPEQSASERARLVRDHFAHLGMMIVEVLVFAQWDRRFAGRVQVSGRECLDDLIKDEAGFVVFVPHIGNWELLAALWPYLHPNPMALALPITYGAVDRLVMRCRTSTGMGIVERTGGLRRAVAGVKAGRAVGFLADQDAGDGGVFVPFFGKPISCERSPVAIARRLGRPVILCTTFRTDDGSHEVLLERMPDVASDGVEADRAALEWIYARLEQHVRLHPSQWLWIHRRWKTQPVAS
jgi:KDO2-lipid IV(A) lauroyltransferase